MNELTPFTIPAEVHTDCHTAETQFESLPWFETALDEDILQLAECNWGGDAPADRVAESFENSIESVKEVFHVLQILRRSGKEIGFECHVQEEPALQWLKTHRPWLHAIIDNTNLPQDEHTALVSIISLQDALSIKTGDLTLKEKLLEVAQEELQSSGYTWKNTTSEVHISKDAAAKVYIIIHKND